MKKLHKIALKVLDCLFIALIGTIAVCISINLGEMKIFYLAQSLDWCKSRYFLSEYSLTIGFLSILIFYMLNFFYKIFKRYLNAEVEKSKR